MLIALRTKVARLLSLCQAPYNIPYNTVLFNCFENLHAEYNHHFRDTGPCQAEYRSHRPGRQQAPGMASPSLSTAFDELPLGMGFVGRAKELSGVALEVSTASSDWRRVCTEGLANIRCCHDRGRA